jgi:hypothetical protein
MTVNDNGGNTPNYFPNSYSELPQPVRDISVRVLGYAYGRLPIPNTF